MRSKVRLLWEHLVPGCILGKLLDLSCNHVSQRTHVYNRKKDNVAGKGFFM